MAWIAFPMAAGDNLQVHIGFWKDLLDAFVERPTVVRTFAAPTYIAVNAGDPIITQSGLTQIHAEIDLDYSRYLDYANIPVIRQPANWAFTDSRFLSVLGLPGITPHTAGTDWIGWTRRYWSVANFAMSATPAGPYFRQVPSGQLIAPVTGNTVQVGEKTYDIASGWVWQQTIAGHFTALGPIDGNTQPTVIIDHGAFDAPAAVQGYQRQTAADWNELYTGYVAMKWVPGTAAFDIATQLDNTPGTVFSTISQGDAEVQAKMTWDSSTPYAPTGHLYISVSAGNYAPDPPPAVPRWGTNYTVNGSRIQLNGDSRITFFSVEAHAYVYPQRPINDVPTDSFGNKDPSASVFDSQGYGFTDSSWQSIWSLGPAVSPTGYTQFYGRTGVMQYPDDAGSGYAFNGICSQGFAIGQRSGGFSWDGTGGDDIACVLYLDVVGGFTKP